MKICFVCNEYPPAAHYGLGTIYRDLAESLVRLGADVSVIGYGKRLERPFEQNGVKIHWLTLPSIFYKAVKIKGYPYSLATFLKRFYLSMHLNKLMHLEKFELVESSDFNSPVHGKPAGKFIVRLEGSVTAYRLAEGRQGFIHPIDGYFERKQLLAADHVIACSQHIAELTNRAFGLDLPFELIYNAVDTNLFSPQGNSCNTKQVLYVGNIMWRKGVFDLLRAAPMVIERHPDAHFVLAGGASGAHLEQLNTELNSLPANVRHQIEVRGKVEHRHLPELYNQSAVFVFPSRVEAFGLTCTEAMGCGRPVVATSCASGPELVEDGVSGLLADPTNPIDLAEKINHLLDEPNYAARLGNNARQRVLDKFDINDFGRRNLDYYRLLLKN